VPHGHHETAGHGHGVLLMYQPYSAELQHKLHNYVEKSYMARKEACLALLNATLKFYNVTLLENMTLQQAFFCCCCFCFFTKSQYTKTARHA